MEKQVDELNIENGSDVFGADIIKEKINAERIIHALENCVACFVDDGGLCFPCYDDDRDLWHFSWNTNDGLEYSLNVNTENFEKAEIVNPSQGIIQVNDNNGYNTKIQILNGMEI